MKTRWSQKVGVLLLGGLAGGCVGGQTGDTGTSGSVCSCEVDTEYEAVAQSLANLEETQDPAWSTVVAALGSPSGYSGDLEVLVPPELWTDRGLAAPTGESRTLVHLTVTPTTARLYTMRERSTSHCSATDVPCATQQELAVDLSVSLSMDEFSEVYAGEGLGVAHADGSQAFITLEFADYPGYCELSRDLSDQVHVACTRNDSPSLSTQ